MGDPVPEGLSPFQKPDTIKLDFTNGVPKFFTQAFHVGSFPTVEIVSPTDTGKMCGMWKMCGKLSGSCDQNRKPQGKISQKGLYFLFLLSGNVSHEGYQCKESPVVSCSLLLLF